MQTRLPHGTGVLAPLGGTVREEGVGGHSIQGARGRDEDGAASNETQGTDGWTAGWALGKVNRERGWQGGHELLGQSFSLPSSQRAQGTPRTSRPAQARSGPPSPSIFPLRWLGCCHSAHSTRFLRH